MPHWKAVVFDVDGTLIDTYSDCIAMWDAYRELFPGQEKPQSHFHPCYFLTWKDSYDYLKIPVRWQEPYRALCQERFARCQKEHFLFPGVVPVVERLHRAGVTLGINTSRLGRSLEPAWREYPDAFSLISKERAVTVDMVERPKPAPDSLLLLAGTLELSPEHMLFVGDGIGDKNCAASAGCGFAWAAWGWHRRPPASELEEAYPVLEQPGELLALLGA